jgi:hypothetical protein
MKMDATEHRGETLTNMTLDLPEELHREMQRHPEVRWAEVARRAIERGVARLSGDDRLLEGSKMTMKEAVRLGRRVNRSAVGRLPSRASS